MVFSIIFIVTETQIFQYHLLLRLAKLAALWKTLKSVQTVHATHKKLRKVSLSKSLDKNKSLTIIKKLKKIFE